MEQATFDSRIPQVYTSGMSDYSRELAEARQTLELSAKVASQFVRQLGALAPILVFPFPGASMGRRPGFQMTVMDDRYWFAKLYELVTFHEIRDSGNFDHPGCVMHFIPVFYNLYFEAMRNYLRGSRGISALWLRHFDGLRDLPEQGSLDGAKLSIVSGVTAHIKGDMANALETCYSSWAARPKPAFESLKRDFFEKNRPTFEAARGAFFLDLNDKQPFPFRPEIGQLLIGTGEKVIGGGLSIDEVYQWRETAWKDASSRLGAAAAGQP